MARDNRDHELLVSQFIEDFGRLFEGFQEDIGSLSQEIVRLRTEAEYHHDDIKHLSKVVVDGNGQPPLLSRIAVIEAAVEAGKETQRRWWELMLVALPGIVSLIATGTFIL
jgi:cell division septum initiation protein DivIVA